MSKLANMLKRAGIVSDAQLDQVNQHLQEHPQPFVYALLELSLIDENTLISFIQNKLLILRADDPVLMNVSKKLADRIHHNIAWEFRVLPVADDGRGNLTLAMADPTDMNAVEAVSTQTGGAYIIRAVANPTTLVQALTRCYGTIFPADRPVPTDALDHRNTAATNSRLADKVPAPPIHSSIATQPSISQKSPTTGSLVSPFSKSSFLQVHKQLNTAETRDTLVSVLGDFLASGFERVLMFVHTRGELRGHDARGPDIALDQVRRITIQSSEPSIFSQVIGARSAYFGPFGQGSEIDRALARALGNRTDPVLAFPVPVAGKCPLVIFAQGLNCSMQIHSINELATNVGQALTRILTQRRSVSAQVH